MSKKSVGLGVIGGVTLAMVVATSPHALAVNADHGDRVVSANPADNTPHVMNGAVMAITQVGNKIIAAGTFTSVSPSGSYSNTADDLTRNRMFAFDATTGAIDPSFNPNLGGTVWSLDTDGTYIYAGGSFTSVGGNAAYKRVVKLTASGAVVPTFAAVPNKVVNEVVVRGSRVYVGGGFTSVKVGATTSARGALAALDATSGAVLPEVNVPFTGIYDPAVGGTTNIKRFDMSPDGTRLVAIGNFSTVGGLARSQLAMLDTGAPTTAVTAWGTTRFDAAHNNCSSSFETFMRDIDFSPDGTYFVVSTTGAFAGGAGSGTMCDSSSRWETTSTSNDPSWISYTGGDTTYGVAVTGSAVYLGGHMRWQNNPFQGDQAGPGAVPRPGIAALDPVNGLPLSWNPGRARGTGAQAMYATPAGLWVGSDTTMIGGERHGRLALMPLAGGSAVPAVAASPLPNDLFLAPTSAGSDLLRRPVGATGAPTGSSTAVNNALDWSTLRGGFLVNGTLYYGLADGRLYKRSFNRSTGAVGSQNVVDLYDDPESGTRIPFAITSMTGSFYDPATHRIYYSVSGTSQLQYRYFTPESEVVGAQTFALPSNGVSFASVAGMTLAGGRILYGSSTDGALRSVPFANGQLAGPATVINSDGTWRFRAILAPNA
jgi:hypothetical protein